MNQRLLWDQRKALTDSEFAVYKTHHFGGSQWHKNIIMTQSTFSLQQHVQQFKFILTQRLLNQLRLWGNVTGWLVQLSDRFWSHQAQMPQSVVNAETWMVMARDQAQLGFTWVVYRTLSGGELISSQHRKDEEQHHCPPQVCPGAVVSADCEWALVAAIVVRLSARRLFILSF